MVDMFADLVPGNEPAKSKNMFDDLLPDTAPANTAAKPPTPDPSSTMVSVARQIAQGASIPATGAALGGSIAGPPGALAGSVAVPLADALGSAYNFVVDQAGAPNWKIPLTSETLKGLLTDAGIFETPKTQAERIANVAGEALAGAGGQIKAGQELAKQSGPILAGVGRALSQAPKTQLVAAPAAASAGQLTAEETKSPLAGLAASLFTGITVGASSRPSLKGIDSRTLKNQAQAAYKAADDAGVIVKADSLNKIRQNMMATISREGYDADLHPGLNVVLKRIEESPTDLTLGEIERSRRVLLNVVRSKGENYDQQRIAGAALDVLDEGMSGLTRSDLVSGSKRGVENLNKARELWRRKAKTEIIEDLLDRAKLQAENYSQSGMENAIRQQFKGLASNKKKMRQFSKAEQALIVRAAKGGPLLTSLRLLGKFNPRGPVSAIAGMGATATLGPGGLVLPVAGAVSQAAATGIRKGRARNALNAISSGRSPRSPYANLTPGALRGLLSNPDFGLIGP